MYVYRVSVKSTKAGSHSKESATDAIQTVLAAWHKSGQICGSESPVFASDGVLSAIVLTPEEPSLESRFNSQYVTAAMARCEEEGLRLTFEMLGEGVESPPACQCANPSAYTLFTSYVSSISPIRCLDCFRPVALYRMKTMASGEFRELISWQSDYQSCDSLQMGCAVLEQEATRELPDWQSDLSEVGRTHCKTLADLAGRPFYYYLYRGEGQSLQAELERRCPSCGNAWRLASPLHDRFDFKCDRCCLLSNIAFDVRWVLVPGSGQA